MRSMPFVAAAAAVTRDAIMFAGEGKKSEEEKGEERTKKIDGMHDKEEENASRHLMDFSASCNGEISFFHILTFVFPRCNHTEW